MKSAAGRHEAIGFDAGKVIKGRKRFLSVDTLVLIGRIFVTAASTGEREGGKKVLQRVQQREKTVSRLHPIWVDGGFDDDPFGSGLNVWKQRVETEKTKKAEAYVMVLEPVGCPSCGSGDIVKHEPFREGKQCYKCRHSECSRCTFIQAYPDRGYCPAVKQQIADMAVNGRGIQALARLLKISRTTVSQTLKKDHDLNAMNESDLAIAEPTQTIVQLC